MREVWTEDRKQKWDFWRENLVLVSRLTNSIEKQMNQIGFVTRFFHESVWSNGNYDEFRNRINGNFELIKTNLWNEMKRKANFKSQNLN